MRILSVLKTFIEMDTTVLPGMRFRAIPRIDSGKTPGYMHPVLENDINNKTAPVFTKAVLRGTPSGARTLDTLIKSQVLYQLS
jgi:hypothetical protein